MISEQELRERNSAAPAQIDPTQLDAGDSWAYLCLLCPEGNRPLTQGGLHGLLAHTKTVHPGQIGEGKPAVPLHPSLVTKLEEVIDRG